MGFSLSRPSEEALGLKVFIHDDFQSAEELGVLCGEVKFRISPALGVELMAMHQACLAAFIKADGDFQNEEEVVAGVADARHDVSDPLGIGEGLVDGVAQLFDQAFKLVVQFQGSPG